MLATADPALIKPLLLNRGHTLGRSWLYRLLAKWLPSSDGILFMENEDWKKRHRTFTPLFSSSNISNFTVAMVQQAVAEAAAVSSLQAWRSEQDKKDAPLGSTELNGFVGSMLADGRSRSDVLSSLDGAAVVPSEEARPMCLLDAGRNLKLVPCSLRDPGQCTQLTHGCCIGGGSSGKTHKHVSWSSLEPPPSVFRSACPATQAIAECLDKDHNYRGPRPEEDLLTFLRGIAMRILLTYAFPVALTQDASVLGSKASAQAGAFSSAAGYPLSPALYAGGCMARSLDEYSRTCFEQMGEAGHASGDGLAGFLAGFKLYRRLYPVAGNIKRCTDTFIDAVLQRAGAGSCIADKEASEGIRFQDKAKGRLTTAKTNEPSGPLVGDNTNKAILERAKAGAADSVNVKAPLPSNFISSMVEQGYSRKEIASDVNHLQGAHKAIAFITTCAIFELSQPKNTKWKAAVIEELERVLGKPEFIGAGAGDKKVKNLPSLMNALLMSGSADSCGSAGAWRLPNREDVDSSSFPVLNRVWKETLRLHAVSLGTLRK
jgi:hypothetical protein